MCDSLQSCKRICSGTARLCKKVNLGGEHVKQIINYLWACITMRGGLAPKVVTNAAISRRQLCDNGERILCKQRFLQRGLKQFNKCYLKKGAHCGSIIAECI